MKQKSMRKIKVTTTLYVHVLYIHVSTCKSGGENWSMK